MSDLSRSWLDKLQKSQNKLIRLVSGFDVLHMWRFPILSVLIVTYRKQTRTY